MSLYYNYEGAKYTWSDWVIREMCAQGYISEAERDV